MLSRRDFLRHGAVGMTALVVPTGFARIASASTAAPALVVVHLRGGADGLNLVVPAGDPFYYSNRPHIQVPPGDELPLDGFFGLNPALRRLESRFHDGELCFVHAVGNPDPSRSHFHAQDSMDYAAPESPSVRDGWLNRALLSSGQTDPVAAFSINAFGLSLTGPARKLAITKLADFNFSGDFQSERRAALASRYALEPGTLLGSSALDALDAVDRVESVDRSTSVQYPGGSELADALRDAAALIKADIGVRFVSVEMSGWDHHTAEIYQMGVVGQKLAGSLDAFQEDLGACASTTLTLCVTEFGRRARENGTGCEHGRGGVMLAMGGGVGGGRVLTRDGWPGLAPEQLDNGQDLAVTTDFRDVFAEILHRHMGLSLAELGPVFPGFGVETASFPGLYA